MNSIIAKVSFIGLLLLLVAIGFVFGKKIERDSETKLQLRLYGNGQRSGDFKDVDIEPSTKVIADWKNPKVYSVTIKNPASCPWNSDSDACVGDKLGDYWKKQGLCQMPVWGFLVRCDSLKLGE